MNYGTTNNSYNYLRGLLEFADLLANKLFFPTVSGHWYIVSKNNHYHSIK